MIRRSISVVSKSFSRKMSTDPAAIAVEIANTLTKPATPVSLKELYNFGQNPTSLTLKQSAGFLLEQLPILLANQIHLIDKLPYGSVFSFFHTQVCV
jgi:hypothetical protein